MQRCFWTLLLIYMQQLYVGLSITVTERAQLASYDVFKPNSTAASYRVSAPRLQQPSNRVPIHLQDVRTGYVYDDVDDVIHIIEPPQYFQHMKRVAYQQGHVTPLPSSLPLKANNAAKWQMKVKEPLQQQQQRHTAMKVDRPARPYAHVRKQTAKPVDATGDLLPAESQRLQLQAPPPALPREILASVRKTERLLQQQHQQQQQQQKQQRAKQRIKTLKTHTVIMEQAYEQDKYAHGKEHKAAGQKWHKSRVRRAVPAPEPAPIEGARRTDTPTTALETLNNAKLGIQQGNKLLLHINDLLKNADVYLPDEGEVRELPPPRSSSTQDKRGVKLNLSAASVRELRVLLEHSLNATQLAMREYRHQLDVKRKKKGKRLQRQQQQLQQANAANNITTKRAHSHSRHTKSDLHASKKSPFQPQLSQSQTDYLATATLLYDDVMTNIRNMLQAKNLQLLEEQQLSNASAQYVHVDDAPPEDTGKLGGLYQLQQYISELQRLVTQLPHSHNNIDGAELLLNTREHTRLAQPGNAELYFINAEGKIYGTALHEQQKARSTLFHRFPDIPVEQGEEGSEKRDPKLSQLDALFVK